MKRGCTAAKSAVTEGGSLECQVSLGENFENVGFSGFSKTHTIFLGRSWAVCGDRLNSL
ncbi:Secreted protein [Pseudomonas sp. IT-P218]